MVASQGLDNAVPTAQMPPTELAPVRQRSCALPFRRAAVGTAAKAIRLPPTDGRTSEDEPFDRGSRRSVPPARSSRAIRQPTPLM